MVDSEVMVPDMGSDDPVDVIEISVKQGDQVEAGQTLFIMEVMKMEVPYEAPAAGEVQSTVQVTVVLAPKSSKGLCSW